MKKLQFPIHFQFKVSTFSNDFSARDASGNIVAYVRQKMFKLKETISIFSDESKSQLIYQIKADRWLDFSAAYAFLDEDGKQFGKIVRKGWRSLWKAEYEIIDENQEMQYSITEENGWIKVMDSILGDIPILNILTGYLFNPSYIVSHIERGKIVRLKKMPSFFGRKFELNKINHFDSVDDDRVMLGLMMMILLERRRG